MKVLVTGATGFVGLRLLPALRRAGHEPVALVRSDIARAEMSRMRVPTAPGDLDQPEALSLPPIDAVIHAAAHFRLAGPRAPYFRTNVDGARGLLRASAAAGAHAFVHVSAAAVVMDDRGSPLRGVDETAPTFPDSFSAYIASKARGEAAVLAADAPSFRALALRPPGIWGAGDAFSKALPAMVQRGQFAFINRGDYPYSTCHVDNVVEALILALDRGVGGRAYFVNDAEPTTFRAFVGGLAQVLGLSVQRAPSIPYGLARAVGRVMEATVGAVSPNRDPPMSSSMVRLIGRAFVTDDAAARRDLGYKGEVTRTAGLESYDAETSHVDTRPSRA